MATDDYLVLKISPKDLATMSFSSIEPLIKALTADDDTIKNMEGKLYFDLDELEDGERDPGEMPQVRAYFAELDRQYPYLPYFLCRDEGEGQVPFYASLLVPFTPEGEAIRFDRQRLERFAVEKIKEIDAFCRRHALDGKENIRRFCELLHLDVIEEVVDEPSHYPFEPERITSPFLIEFFQSGFYFHTIDASDEPVLFTLVDDPAAAYYATAELTAELFPSSAYPVIALEMTLYDIPENPLRMTFVYNVELERHRQELSAYSEMTYLTCNFLYKKDKELYYGFTRAMDLSVTLRERIRRLLLESSNLLRAIPRDERNFTRAVEELFASKARPDSERKRSENYGESFAESYQEPTPPVETTPENLETKPDIPSLSSKFAIVDDDAEAETETSGFPSRQPNPRGDLEVLEEFEVADSTEEFGGNDGMDDQRRVVRAPYESAIPTSVLPESIQRITRALSKPVRRPAKSITEDLAIPPAPKKVLMRSEDQLERLSRRLLIMQNNVDQTERENYRLSGELKAAREEIERLQRENLALENRWWKFWK